MLWLSIILTLVPFFLAGGPKPENRARAAAIGRAKDGGMMNTNAATPAPRLSLLLQVVTGVITGLVLAGPLKNR